MSSAFNTHFWIIKNCNTQQKEKISVYKNSKKNFGWILAEFWLNLAEFWLNFGWILAEFWLNLAKFWLHFDSIWLHLTAFWLHFATPRIYLKCLKTCIKCSTLFGLTLIGKPKNIPKPHLISKPLIFGRMYLRT